ncbi:MAG: hypothetical protein H7844_10755 [Nitrospirae bacterium YQR-1]
MCVFNQKKHYCLTILTILLISLLNGCDGGTDSAASYQSLTGNSAITLGGDSDDAAFTIAKTSDDGFIVGGYTMSSGQGNRDMLIVKMNKLYSVYWQYTYGGADIDNVQSIKQSTDGGYIAAGYTQSFGAGEYDMWILKLDSEGLISWQYTYGGVGTEYAKSVEQTTDGGYIVLGYTRSFSAGADDIWVLKLNSDGSIKWQNTYGTSSYVENSYCIKQTTDGGYVITGNRVGTGDGASDILFVRLDSTGNINWSKTYGKGKQSFSFSAQETTDGGYIVSGYSDAFGAEGMDVWVFKLTGGGVIEWQKVYGGAGNDYAYSIIQTTDGGYLVSGSTESFGSGGYDMWVVKLKSDGTVQWQNAYGGGSDDYAGSYSIAQTSDGGFLIAGNTNSYGAGGADFWIVKLGSDGSSGLFTTQTQAAVSDTGITGKDILLTQTVTTVTPASVSVSPVKSAVKIGGQKTNTKL